MNLRIAAVIFAFCSLMPLGVAQATSADIDLLPGVTLAIAISEGITGMVMTGAIKTGGAIIKAVGWVTAVLAAITGMVAAGVTTTGGRKTTIHAAGSITAMTIKTNISIMTVATIMVTIKNTTAMTTTIVATGMAITND